MELSDPKELIEKLKCDREDCGALDKNFRDLFGVSNGFKTRWYAAVCRKCGKRIDMEDETGG